MSLEVAEAKMRGKSALADYALNRAVEYIDKALGVFPVTVATHGWLIHGYFRATCFNKVNKLFADMREKCLRDGPSIRVVLVGKEKFDFGDLLLVFQ